LPFVVGALDEVPLKLELSVVDGAESLSGIAITKADIEGESSLPSICGVSC
jgi:hypothetical protein